MIPVLERAKTVHALDRAATYFLHAQHFVASRCVYFVPENCCAGVVLVLSLYVFCFMTCPSLMDGDGNTL
jgi:hypothetical protein